MSIRKAFVMSVRPGFEQEYEKRHNPIWPELEKTLRDHGVSNYSIFLHPETRQLFGYAEIRDEEQWNAIATTLIMRDGILEIEGRPQFPYKCGCGNNDNGKPCDKFRGNFLGECLNGICDVRVWDAGESGCSSDS